MRTYGILPVITMVGLLGASATTPAAGHHQVVASTVNKDGPLLRSSYIVQVDPHPLQRFEMIGLVKDVPASQLRGSILLLPPLGSGFPFYEQRDTNDARGSSIAEFFALRDFAV